MCGYQEEVSEAEDSGERLALIGNRVFALGRWRQRIEQELARGKINCHQIVLKNVRADQTVSVAHGVLFRDVDNTVVEQDTMGDADGLIGTDIFEHYLVTIDF